MINKLQKVSSLENIYNNLESGMPENKSIKDYALPNARQWLGGRYVALWVLPIYLFGKIAKFIASSAFIKPYSSIKFLSGINSITQLSIFFISSQSS